MEGDFASHNFKKLEGLLIWNQFLMNLTHRSLSPFGKVSKAKIYLKYIKDSLEWELQVHAYSTGKDGNIFLTLMKSHMFFTSPKIFLEYFAVDAAYPRRESCQEEFGEKWQQLQRNANGTILSHKLIDLHLHLVFLWYLV